MGREMKGEMGGEMRGEMRGSSVGAPDCPGAASCLGKV